MDELDCDIPEPIDSQETAQGSIRKHVISNYYSRSDIEGLKQLLFHVSAFVTSITLAWWLRESKLWLIGIIFHSFIVSFLFHGLHETTHETAFKTRDLNVLVRNIYGFLSFRPPIHYYYYHWAHHRFTESVPRNVLTGNVNKDPELFDSFLDIHITSYRSYFAYLSGVMFWLARITTIFRHAFLNFDVTNFEYFLKSERSQSRCRNEARKFLFLYLLIFAGCLCDTMMADTVLYYWILPSFIGQVHLRFYLLAEHRGCLQSTNISDNTRTTYTMRLYSKLAWNMPYHSEHHAWPGVPFFLLEELHEKVMKKTKSGCIPNGETGYLAVNYKLINKLHNDEVF